MKPELMAIVLAVVTLGAAGRTAPGAEGPGVAGAHPTNALQDNAAPGGGVKITELRSENSPVVTFRIVLRAGSINDPKGLEGLNALTATIIAEGGTKDLTYPQVQERLYPWAASISTQIDHEITTFIASVHRDHLDGFYALLSEIILRPRLDEADFTRVKDLGINYLTNTLRATDDEGLGKQSLNAFLFQDHPYRTTEFGTVKGLTAATLKDVRDYHTRMYTQANLWVGITGGYPADFAARVRKDFAALPAGTRADVALPATAPPEGMEALIVEKPARAYAVSMGFPISVTRKDKDFYALMVANSFFGEHRTFNGVLMNSIRGDRGLNYGDYSYIEKFVGGLAGGVFPDLNTPLRQQYFSIWLRPMPPEQTLFGIRTALFKLKELVEKGMTEQQFTETRKFLVNYSKLWAATSGRRLGYVMDSEFYGTDYFIDRIEKELASMTAADVNAAIKKHLNASNIRIAVVVDEGKGADFLRDLSGNATPPMTYQAEPAASLLTEDQAILGYPLKINAAKSRVVHARELFEE
jgi:zinc protease